MIPVALMPWLRPGGCWQGARQQRRASARHARQPSL